MHYMVTTGGGGVLVTISGRLTFDDHESFERLLAETRSASGTCTFDIAALEFVDSAGLGMLLIAKDEADRGGVSLMLLGACGQVRRVIEMARLNDVLTCG